MPTPPSIRLALENWPAAAVLIDHDGCITACNRTVARLFGYHPRDLRGLALVELIPEWQPLVERDRPTHPRSIRRRATGHRRNGGTFPLQFSQLLVEADSALWTLVSIRPRLRSAAAGSNFERDRHSPEERLRAAVKAGRIGTWILDLRKQTVWWDDLMYEIAGRQRQEEILPMAVTTTIMHPDDEQWVAEAVSGFLAGDAQEFSLEFRILGKGGATKWIAIAGRIERDELGHAIRMIGATMDVTARKNAEETVRHAQKIEALGTLAGGIAHDFNNILLAIAGNTRLARSELPPDHPIQGGLAEVAKASARATELVNRILTFSRQSESRLEIIQLQPAVEDAVKLLRATLPAMVAIRCEFANDLPAVRADATQIHQIVINLLTNSAHAIGEEAPGIITVELDQVHFAQNDVLMPELTAGCYVRLSVTDNGCGMDKATLDRVFDPFFTTKPVGRGTGLGLSVVHGIVRNHEGVIIASSELGRGASFRLYFPAVDEPAAEVKPPDHAMGQPQVHGRGRRVIYIDDEEALVFLMSRVLQKSGYDVTGFSEAEKALQVLQERPNDFDVVVTDLSMPGMSGFHVARAVQGIRADLPVIVTSGYVRPEDRETARQIGVRELVLKPDTVEELAQSLERVFER